MTDCVERMEVKDPATKIKKDEVLPPPNTFREMAWMNHPAHPYIEEWRTRRYAMNNEGTTFRIHAGPYSSSKPDVYLQNPLEYKSYQIVIVDTENICFTKNFQTVHDINIFLNSITSVH